MASPLEKNNEESVQQFLYSFFGINLPSVENKSPVPLSKEGDTLSVSVVKKSEDEHKSDPAVVQLAPPLNPNEASQLIKMSQNLSITPLDVQLFLQNVKQQYYDICTDIMDKFAESQKQIADEQRKKASSDFYLALQDSIKQSEKGTDQGNVALVSIMSIIAGIFIVGGAVGVQAAVQTSVSIQALQQAIAPALGLVESMPAQFLLLGGFFSALSMFRAAAQTVLNKESGSEYDLEFGKNYAEDVIKTLTSPLFNYIANSMATQNNNKDFTAISKTTLFMNALALLTKLEVGHLTMEELAAMISGKISFQDNDPRTQLVELIREQLAQLEPKKREQLLDALFAYYNSNPRVEKLIDSVNAFKAVRSNGNSASADANKVIQQSI